MWLKIKTGIFSHLICDTTLSIVFCSYNFSWRIKYKSINQIYKFALLVNCFTYIYTCRQVRTQVYAWVMHGSYAMWSKECLVVPLSMRQ